VLLTRLVGTQLTFRKSNLEFPPFGRTLLNRISRAALEREVSLDVPDRLRYAVDIPTKGRIPVLSASRPRLFDCAVRARGLPSEGGALRPRRCPVCIAPET
jgi:hypothetical protein